MSAGRPPRLIDRRAALAVAARPRLWGAAVTLALRTAPRDWWRRWPPLPTPSVAYAAFRLHTALGGPAPPGPLSPGAPGSDPPHREGFGGTGRGYGASSDRVDRPLDAAEVVAFLEWCRRMTVLSRGRRRH